MQNAGILMLLIQIGFAIHAIRRGYSLFWVFLIIFVPLIGCILYTVMVLLPEAKESRTARKASKSLATALGTAINPKKELNRKIERLEMADTLDNRTDLAREYLKHGMFDEAIELYERSLTGLYRTDPELLFGLATARFEAGRFEPAKAALDTLAEAHPDLAKPEARLLAARTLEALGETGPALDLYAELARRHLNAEIQCRYALLLKRAGREDEARGWFAEIVRDAKGTSQHAYRLNKEWIDIARREVG
jgi:hypothetical protein